MNEYSYQGSELDLFQHAVNWKRYYATRLEPYIAGDVLEVGAGIGGTAHFLRNDRVTTWTCLEPDETLTARLESRLRDQPLGIPTRVICGAVATLDAKESFDTLLYIDVLEHIEDDRAELLASARHLRPGGHLIVLGPAHNWLFSPFDRAIGHFRRYNKTMLVDAGPHELRLARAFYLDSVGMLASLANRALLKARYPTMAQIRFWDSNLVPASRVLDPLTANRLGKTVVAVWTRAAGDRSQADPTPR
jgi:SAM-dependent methyltransferase